ncbi:MAG: DUF429 domain-containing protein, partial [Anaerolineales bacterium]
MAPVLVADSDSLLARIQDRAINPGSVLVGFDFPIGLPDEYARLSGITHFMDALQNFGTGC